MKHAAECPNVALPCGENCINPGYGFVAIQKVQRFYDYEAALVSGSVFPDLVYPKGKYGPNETTA